MTPELILNNRSLIETDLELNVLDVQTINYSNIARNFNFVKFNEWYIFPILIRDRYLSKDNISVVADGSIDLGEIVFSKGLSYDELSLKTDLHKMVVLIESTNLGANGVVEFDYIFVKLDYVSYISRYYDSSLLWGDFIHIDPDNIPFNSNHLVSQPKSIIADCSIAYPHPYFFELSYQNALQRTLPEIYLKFYHYLEFLFDYKYLEFFTTRTIESDFDLMLSHINNRPKSEIDYLYFFTSDFNPSINLFSLLDDLKVNSYRDSLERIIFHGGRNISGPFQNIGKIINICLTPGFNVYYSQSDKNKEEVRKLISILIYRTRCCIAHSRLGEYIITTSDYKFVNDIALPFLKGVIKDLLR